jgi:multicomponent Na+:H+ antiporter subunit E
MQNETRNGVGVHSATASGTAVHAASAGQRARAEVGPRLLLAATGVFLVWLLLVGSLAPAELLTGVLVALLVASLSVRHLALLDGVHLRPALPLHLLRFAGTFLVALLEANVDMARRVLAPRLPIQPGMVEVRTGLRSPLGKLLLANSITLTPGTLTVDLVEDRIHVHWIDTSPGADLERATRAIAARFEQHLQEIFE